MDTRQVIRGILVESREQHGLGTIWLSPDGQRIPVEGEHHTAVEAYLSHAEQEEAREAFGDWPDHDPLVAYWLHKGYIRVQPEYVEFWRWDRRTQKVLGDYIVDAGLYDYPNTIMLEQSEDGNFRTQTVYARDIVDDPQSIRLRRPGM